ncbi:MAG: adenylate/guanylate cyclase domain-containing protein [Elusimicrobiota bacterium]
MLTFILVNILVRPINKLSVVAKKVEKGEFDVKVDIKSRNEIGSLATAFNEITEGLKEREFIKTTFKSYVPKQVAELLLTKKDEIGLKGETKTVSVLFSDIRGFTTLSEKLQPEEVVEMLNDYFKLMTEIIFKNDGVLDKFMGDAILCFWNAPFEQKDHALKAVKCGMEMLEALFRYNLERKKLNKQIFLSETTYNFIKDSCDVTTCGKMKFKGKEEEIEIYELNALKTL